MQNIISVFLLILRRNMIQTFYTQYNWGLMAAHTHAHTHTPLSVSPDESSQWATESSSSPSNSSSCLFIFILAVLPGLLFYFSPIFSVLVWIGFYVSRPDNHTSSQVHPATSISALRLSLLNAKTTSASRPFTEKRRALSFQPETSSRMPKSRGDVLVTMAMDHLLLKNRGEQEISIPEQLRERPGEAM